MTHSRTVSVTASVFQTEGALTLALPTTLALSAVQMFLHREKNSLMLKFMLANAAIA